MTEAGRPAHRARRWLVAGVAAAGLVYGSLGLLVAAVQPPFSSADEVQHTAYALELAHGSLPELDTPVRSRLPGMPGLPAGCGLRPAAARAAVDAGADRVCGVVLGRPLTNFDLVYTANHPPLFYAAEAVPLRAGTALGHPWAGLRAARVLNVVFGLGVVVATAALARVLSPGRPGIAVGAAAIVGVLGAVVTSAGQIYNDALATALVTGLLAAAAGLVRRGPRPRIMVGLVLLVVAAPASRASGAVALVAVLPAVAAGVGLHASGGPGRRLGRGAATASALLALVVAAVGWFYLRNARLYGDPTAAGRIAEMFPVAGARRSAGRLLVDGRLWWSAYRGLFARPRLVTGQVELIVVGVAAVAAAGLGVTALRAAVRGGRQRRTAARPPAWPGDHRRPAEAIIWLLVAGHCLLVVATFVGYVAAGGAPFARYLLPMVPVLAVGVAAGWAALPLGRWRGAPPLVAVVALAAATVVLIGREVAWKQRGFASLGLAGRLRASWALAGPGSPGVGLGVLAATAAVGVVLLAVALGRLGDPAVDGCGQGRGARPGEGAGVAAAGVGVAGGLEQVDDRLGEVVGEGVPIRLPDQADGTATAGGGRDRAPAGTARSGAGPSALSPSALSPSFLGDGEELPDDLPHGRDVGGDDRDAGGQRLQGR